MAKQKSDPIECQVQAKKIVAAHITERYAKNMEFRVYIIGFTNIGLSWKATLSTTLPNSAFFVVEYYALEAKTSLWVYAQTETFEI